MKDNIKVSIVCFTFNHEKYIEKTLENFVNQKTNFSFEIIVHDDASTDKTIDIINKYKDKYPKLFKTIYQKENQYSQGKDNINFVKPYINGKYVAFCEGDDYWCDEEKLQRQYDYLENHCDISFCSSSINIMNDEGIIYDKKIDYNHDYDIDIKDYLKSHITLQTATIFCKTKDLLKQPKYYDKASFDDLSRNLYLLSLGKCHYFSSPMANYRYMASGSWTLKNNDIQKEKIVHEMVKNVYLAFDESTNKKYHLLIKDYLLKYDFDFAVSLNNYEEYKKDKYKKLYKLLPLKQKLKLFLKRQKFIYKLYKIIKHRKED